MALQRRAAAGYCTDMYPLTQHEYHFHNLLCLCYLNTESRILLALCNFNLLYSMGVQFNELTQLDTQVLYNC